MEPILKAIEATVGQWDANLSEVRVEDNVVRALKCAAFMPTDLVDGDVYYKIIGATFIDEEAAAGRHIVTVDVVDENLNRVQGARIWHGWPTHRFPEFDERVQMTIFGSQLAEWALYADFDAWKVQGPYWVQVADGKSDAFYGAGLPWKRHVCFAVVFQKTVYKAMPVGTLKEMLITEGRDWQVIEFNPDAALQKVIFRDGFVPNSPEFYVGKDGVTYVAQRAEHMGTGEVRIYYAPTDDYNNVTFVRDGG